MRGDGPPASSGKIFVIIKGETGERGYRIGDALSGIKGFAGGS